MKVCFELLFFFIGGIDVGGVEGFYHAREAMATAADWSLGVMAVHLVIHHLLACEISCQLCMVGHKS